MSDQPKCPVCGRKGVKAGPDLYRCQFGHLFDDDPNEGGTHSDRDPSRRLEQQEELAKARRQNLERRPRAASNFRFAGRR